MICDSSTLLWHSMSAEGKVKERTRYFYPQAVFERESLLSTLFLIFLSADKSYWRHGDSLNYDQCPIIATAAITRRSKTVVSSSLNRTALRCGSSTSVRIVDIPSAAGCLRENTGGRIRKAVWMEPPLLLRQEHPVLASSSLPKRMSSASTASLAQGGATLLLGSWRTKIRWPSSCGGAGTARALARTTSSRTGGKSSNSARTGPLRPSSRCPCARSRAWPAHRPPAGGC